MPSLMHKPMQTFLNVIELLRIELGSCRSMTPLCAKLDFMTIPTRVYQEHAQRTNTRQLHTALSEYRDNDVMQNNIHKSEER